MKIITVVIYLICFSYLRADQSFEIVSNKLSTLINSVNSGKLHICEALLEVSEKEVELFIKPSVIVSEATDPVLSALGVCSGAVHGALCFNINDLPYFKSQNIPVIWVTDHIYNDDLCHMKDIAGILAIKEDPSSHAVIVARVSNIPCLTLPEGVEKIEDTLFTSRAQLKQGDLVTLDAFNGKVFLGLVPLHHPEKSPLLEVLMEWSEEYAVLEVHGNADTAEEAKLSLAYGAKGVDPRTEHMFFHPNRLHLFRKVILSEGKFSNALEELEDLQKSDFIELYQTMGSYPVKIRLLDPPLHEFLPSEESLLITLAEQLDIPLEQLKNQVDQLQEVNPMMGHRGIRLLLTYPKILKMQAKAIFKAAMEVSTDIEPYIVLPMIINQQEVLQAKAYIDEAREEIYLENAKFVKYHLGTMIETPRACLLAETIAPHVDFISFGTNDLTGQTLALSRGDVYEKFLKFYFDHGLLDSDPFSNLDLAVRELIDMTVKKMRLADHPIAVGLCGEHGGEMTGVFQCHILGLDSVSCAPTRIPSVKLFAAQAAILYPR